MGDAHQGRGHQEGDAEADVALRLPEHPAVATTANLEEVVEETERGEHDDAAEDHKCLVRERHLRQDVGGEVPDDRRHQDRQPAHRRRTGLVLVLGAPVLRAEDRLALPDALEVADEVARAEE